MYHAVAVVKFSKVIENQRNLYNAHIICLLLHHVAIFIQAQPLPSLAHLMTVTIGTTEDLPPTWESIFSNISQ